MLDVHPVHSPIHGWRDFLIHIATIVVGLCIAVGIEQLVELVHHHRQTAEARAALRLERETNYKTMADNTKAWRWGVAELQNNLLVMQYLLQHPGTPQEQLPGVLRWSTANYSFSFVVWDAVRQSGIISLMPRNEIEAQYGLYEFLHRVNDFQIEGVRAIVRARQYELLDANPSHLNATQLAAEIESTQDALTEQFVRGTLLRNLFESFPDFPAAPSEEELNIIHHAPNGATAELLAPARALTLERLRRAGYVDSNPVPQPEQ